ncbi:MAG: oxygenase MpaB family protein [Nannocystales bacterium]
MVLSDARLLTFAHRTDPLAEAAVQGLPRLRPYKLLEAVEDKARDGDASAQAFIDAVFTVPDWVDFERVERGAALSRIHGFAHLLALNFGALLEGYASHSLAAPLVATGRLRQDTRKRLYETGQVFHNGRQQGALRPGAPGHRSILAVRLLHAMVRGHLARVGYEATDGGAQIHQLDLAHTAVQICHVGRRGLTRLGVDLPPEDTEALHHFARLVHTWHGVEAELLPETVHESAALHARLAALRYDASNPAAQPLVHAALDAMAHAPPFFLPRPALAAVTRLLIGDALADAWSLGEPGRWRHGIAALTITSRSASRLARAAPRTLAPPLQWAQESLYMHTLARGLGAAPKRAFGALADHRWGRRATL